MAKSTCCYWHLFSKKPCFRLILAPEERKVELKNWLNLLIFSSKFSLLLCSVFRLSFAPTLVLLTIHSLILDETGALLILGNCLFPSHAMHFSLILATLRENTSFPCKELVLAKDGGWSSGNRMSKVNFKSMCGLFTCNSNRRLIILSNI